MKRIVCAALKIKYANRNFIIPCVRHSDGYKFLKNIMGIKASDCVIEEGFLDADNVYFDRYNAKIIATEHEQFINKDATTKLLYSEEIY